MNSFGVERIRVSSNSGSSCTLPYPPRTAMSAAIDGSAHARENAAARSAAVPERYVPVRAKTSSSYAGSYPNRRSSSTPRSNSSREKGLAGETMAMRAPGLTAAGFNTVLEKTRHFVGDTPMGVVAQDLAQQGAAAGHDGRGQEPLLRTAVARERVFGPLVGNAAVFDRMDQCFQHRCLHLRILGAVRGKMPAHEHTIASCGNCLHRRFWNGVGIRQCLHLEIVTQ